MTLFPILDVYASSVVVGLVGAYGLARWTRWLGGHLGVPRFVTWLRWPFFVVPVLAIVTFACSYSSVRDALEQEAFSAADRQRVLADALAEAAWNVTLTPALLVLCALAMLHLTWRYRWSARARRTPEGKPPYR